MLALVTPTASAVGVVRSPAAVDAAFAGHAVYLQSTPAGELAWEWVSNFTPTGAAMYSTAVPTRRDAVDGDDALHHFMVVAHGTAPFSYWESNAATGASVDNLAPAAPLSLTAVRNGVDVELDWSPSGANEADFADYVVYRDDAPGVTPETGTEIGSTAGLALTDTGAPLTELHYVVVARDVHGNHSTPSNEADIVMPTGVNPPALTALRLGPNAPNPFSRATTFPVGLPASGEVRVEVYDVAGRRIRAFAQTLPAGWQSLPFDGRDGRGQPLPNGVYFFRVATADQQITRKFVVQR
jgi:hypothetical protein